MPIKKIIKTTQADFIFMRSVQVRRANGPLELGEIFQNLVIDKSESKYRHAAYAIVTPLPKKDHSLGSSTPGCLVTKLQVL
jgi:hypothetical protein